MEKAVLCLCIGASVHGEWIATRLVNMEPQAFLENRITQKNLLLKTQLVHGLLYVDGSTSDFYCRVFFYSPKSLLFVVLRVVMKSTFLKTYVLFTLLVLLVVIPLELLFSPNHPKTIAEFGWGYFISNSLFGMVILYAFLSLIGTAILLKKAYDPATMGILSLILGFAIEFIFMKPDWVHAFLTFKVTGGVIFAVFISAFYWFAVWGFPSYVIKRFAKRESTS